MNTSIAQQIIASSDHEYEASDRLAAELRLREAQGLMGSETDEISDALNALGEQFAYDQESEIEAEMAIERYYENASWAEYEAFDHYERSMGLC